MADFTYKAIVTKVEVVGNNAALSAVTAVDKDQVALTLSALFPLDRIKDVHPLDEIEISVALKPKAEASSEIV